MCEKWHGKRGAWRGILKPYPFAVEIFDFTGNFLCQKINYRPININYSGGDNSKAKEILGWKPKYTLDNIIDEMLSFELESAKNITL